MAPKKDAKKKDVEEPAKLYKGVYRNQGLWRARIWNKDTEVYLGHFSEQELAARAYDKAAIRLRGIEAATRSLLNMDEASYSEELNGIMSMSFEQLVISLRESGVKQEGLK